MNSTSQPPFTSCYEKTRTDDKALLVFRPRYESIRPVLQPDIVSYRILMMMIWPALTR